MGAMRARILLVAAVLAGVGMPGMAVEPSSPCAPPVAADPMPEESDHDHADPAQHAFECRLAAVSSLDLSELVPQPILFGEIDVAGDLAVVALTFADSGFVTLDVSDPAAPTPLARFRGPACETKTDLDCGADVKLSPDGRFAFLALQRSRRGDARRARELAGIITVDVSDPRAPTRVAFTAISPVGVHTLTLHEIAGELYLFARSRENDRPGETIFRVGDDGRLSRVGRILADGAHDRFLFSDPADGKTYLYLAGAQSGLLLVYDVTDPRRPAEVGRWKPEPDVPGEVWYVHNAWTFRHDGRRYTFVGPELYEAFAGLPPAHGSAAGPLWLLDTTDHAKPRLVGEWRNPGEHAGGNLTFSPHNTWYAGGGITWTAHYHGGVWVLDWNEVLAGRARRPREIGYHVPHEIRRPFVTSDATEKFITHPALLTRPLVWDVVVHGDVAYASDITGGFVTLRPASQGGSPPAEDGTPAPARDGGIPSWVVPFVVADTVISLAMLGYIVRRRRRSGPNAPGW